MLAAGHLTGGQMTAPGIVFTYTVEDVPEADLYPVEISDRGALSYTAKQMAANDWMVDVSSAEGITLDIPETRPQPRSSPSSIRIGRGMPCPAGPPGVDPTRLGVTGRPTIVTFVP